MLKPASAFILPAVAEVHGIAERHCFQTLAQMQQRDVLKVNQVTGIKALKHRVQHLIALLFQDCLR